MKHFWVFIGALLLAIATALGAYGAHGLQSATADFRSIEAFGYAVQYQLICGLGLFAVAWATSHFKALLVNLAGFLLLIGCILFSLSIYLLVIFHWRPFPLITPAGGICMILGWLVFALAAFTALPRKNGYY
ncbi:MAG: DUF423 domain-containing protein [Burkholderiales bacterium]|nr:DUF423 domain-containing protein [Burkholderiales bacterium]